MDDVCEKRALGVQFIEQTYMSVSVDDGTRRALSALLMLR